MKTQILYIIVFCAFLFTSCNQESDIKPDFIANTIQLEFNNNIMSFSNSSSLFEADANGYTEQAKLLSIFRRVSDKNRRSVQLRITDFDMGSLIKNPKGRLDLQENVRLDLFPGDGMELMGRNGDIRLTILSKENNVIKGTFEGIVRDQANPEQVYEIKNGKFLIKIVVL